MQNFDKPNHVVTIEMYCATDFDTEVEDMVVFELVVPGVAKVPPPRQHLAVEQLMVYQSSVTSTVPGTILLQLRANDTASATAWRTTATLSVPGIRPSSLC